MEQEMKKYESGVQAMLELVGGKWRILILHQLISGKKRTSELRRAIPGITQKVLTQQLRELEKNEIIHRIIHPQIPPKVEYELTEYGLTLQDIIDRICLWGENHLDRVYGDKSRVLGDHFSDYIPLSTST
ncbi:winged helix-turn-helix transcriptional regulator [Paenibacillus polymyxa]|uniref:Winged helix-turn-helix transcriptional regulator n=2 Tax=Paenibacillus amylolyticus TaxID=1451 RepID=A0ABD8B020_PAEAM|nr:MULTISPECIES: winged helix-turn-helix transcriptional regulator [Paenibacillus]ETT52714.1 HTH-type transcriptional regulator [Paenibacillus sp. FSL H7-689]SDC70459.1 transcriptional regulator, HxlR family [Paenibacillus sp. CF095]